MAELGQFALSLAFAASAIGLMAALSAMFRKTGARLAFAMLHTAFAACVAAGVALVMALLQHDFQIKYVAEYSDRSLPTAYLVAAFWGGQGGSLLLWAMLLAAFSLIAYRGLRRTLPEATLPVAALLLGVQCFFFSLLVYVNGADPFARSGLVPSDGAGLNPLLRTVEMLLHPPALYLGFVGSTMPFALMIGALWAGRLDAASLGSIRRWLLFSWATLTAGIILGAEWAYVELGWGGYWAWDPVENASLLPWLAMTASLHAVSLARRGMLRLTSFILISLTFALCVFATLLTRSGIVASVHAFGKSPLLYCFLGLLVLIAALCIVTALKRRSLLRSEARLHGLFNRPAMTVVFIVALLGAALVVFWGTMLPVFSQSAAGTQLTWDAMRYNIAAAPFALVLLAALAVCAMVSERADRAASPKLLAIPVLLGVAAGMIAWASIPVPSQGGTGAALAERILTRCVPPLLIGLAVAAAGAAVQAVAVEFRERRRVPPRARMGALLAHAGIAALLFGVAGSGFVESREITLKPGESTTVGGYQITFDGLTHREPPDGSFHEAVANLSFAAGSARGTLTPSMIAYANNEHPHSEVSVKSRLSHDLYAILSAYGENTASFKLLVYPLTIWLWIGGAMMLAGSITALVPRRAAWPAHSEAEAGRAAQPRHCPACGAEQTVSGANFCPKCGAPLKEQHVEA